MDRPIHSIIITALRTRIFPISPFPSGEMRFWYACDQKDQNHCDKGSSWKEINTKQRQRENGDKAEKGDIWKIGPGFSKEGKEEREREKGNANGGG